MDVHASTLLSDAGSDILGLSTGAGASDVLVSVQGDGVIQYDAVKERRVRSWALGSRRRLAAPVVWDAGSERYLAALLPPGEKVAPATLVAFEEDAGSTLDALPAVATLPDGAFAVFPAAAPRVAAASKSRMAVDAPAGCSGALVVSAGGGVRWLTLDGAERGTHAAADGACAQAAAACTETDARGKQAQCVAVVTAARASGAATASHRLDVYVATPAKLLHAASAALEPPADAAHPRVVALTCSGRGGAAVLWSDGSWVVLAAAEGSSDAPAALQPVRSRRLGCFDIAGKAAAVAATPGQKKRRSGGAEDDPAAAPPGGSMLSRVGAAPFGGAYVALLGARAGGSGAMLTVLDVSYGAVHAAQRIEAAGAAADGWRAHCITLPAGAPGARVRIACATPSGVLIAHLDAPPLSLAAVVGALASPAASEVLTADELERQAAPPQGAVAAPLWRRVPAATAAASAPAAGAAGRVDAAPSSSSAIVAAVEVDAVWDTRAMETRDAEHAATAQRLLDAAALPTAAAVTSALLPLLTPGASGAAQPPSRVVDAAVLRCVRDSLWEPLRLLLEGGHVAHAAACPALVDALLRAHQLSLLRDYLSHATEVAAADLALALAAALAAAAADHETTAVMSSVTPLRDAAADAVSSAEAAVRSAADDADARLGVARLLVAAVEDFSPGEAALLHAVVAARRDDGAAIEAIRTLSPEEAVALLTYLHRWVRLYHARLGRWSGARVVGVPGLAQVLSWASLALDGHFLRLAAHADAAVAARKLASAIKAHLVSIAGLAPLEGPVQHLCAGKLLPSPAGTVSAHYSVEMLHL